MANIWRDAVPSTTKTEIQSTSLCEEYAIPAGTLIYIDPGSSETLAVTLTSSGIYRPNCGDESSVDSLSSISSNILNRDPFYGSVTPIAYTISATTVVAWLLLLLLIISPRRRPWFQMFSTLFVAVSLTVFLAQATSVLEYQYNRGYQDAEELRSKVIGGLAFRICHVVSTFILWLAHIQVLLRLFDRYKEKLIIKYSGLVLAVIDTVFWCLVYFVVPYNTSNHIFTEIIPVLAYLFQITIQVLYASAVILYSIRKRQYAYHPKALIIAIFSVASILMPLIFFILDISEYWIAGWSDFIRWVTDCAASVVVWEWVDIIENLEKKKQKNGVLGRQIFDDDINLNGSNGAGRLRSSRQGDSLMPFSFHGKSAWAVSRSGSSASTSTNYPTLIRLSSLRPSSPAVLDSNGITHNPQVNSPFDLPSVNSSEFVRHVHPIKRGSRIKGPESNLRSPPPSPHEPASHLSNVEELDTSQRPPISRNNSLIPCNIPRRPSNPMSASPSSNPTPPSVSFDSGAPATHRYNRSSPTHPIINESVDYDDEDNRISASPRASEQQADDSDDDIYFPSSTGQTDPAAHHVLDGSPPNNFEPHDGFQIGDYWDEKDPNIYNNSGNSSTHHT